MVMVKFPFVVLCVCILSTVWTYGDIRLVGSSRDTEGRVEVFRNGTWGSVCDYGFDRDAARVVCRMLGHFKARPLVRGKGYGYGQSAGPVQISAVSCSGSEYNIFDCLLISTRNTCRTRDVGVDCQPPHGPSGVLISEGSVVYTTDGQKVVSVTCKAVQYRHEVVYYWRGTGVVCVSQERAKDHSVCVFKQVVQDGDNTVTCTARNTEDRNLAASDWLKLHYSHLSPTTAASTHRQFGTNVDSDDTDDNVNVDTNTTGVVYFVAGVTLVLLVIFLVVCGVKLGKHTAKKKEARYRRKMEMIELDFENWLAEGRRAKPAAKTAEEDGETYHLIDDSHIGPNTGVDREPPPLRFLPSVNPTLVLKPRHGPLPLPPPTAHFRRRPSLPADYLHPTSPPRRRRHSLPYESLHARSSADLRQSLDNEYSRLQNSSAKDYLHPCSTKTRSLPEDYLHPCSLKRRSLPEDYLHPCSAKQRALPEDYLHPFSAKQRALPEDYLHRRHSLPYESLHARSTADMRQSLDNEYSRLQNSSAKDYLHPCSTKERSLPEDYLHPCSLKRRSLPEDYLHPCSAKQRALPEDYLHPCSVKRRSLPEDYLHPCSVKRDSLPENYLDPSCVKRRSFPDAPRSCATPVFV